MSRPSLKVSAGERKDRTSNLDSRAKAALNLLESWIAEGETADENAKLEADAEVAEFKKKLDIDVILCAQALTAQLPSGAVTVATSNVSHISSFVPADVWTSISP